MSGLLRSQSLYVTEKQILKVRKLFFFSQFRITISEFKQTFPLPSIEEPLVQGAYKRYRQRISYSDHCLNCILSLSPPPAASHSDFPVPSLWCCFSQPYVCPPSNRTGLPAALTFLVVLPQLLHPFLNAVSSTCASFGGCWRAVEGLSPLALILQSKSLSYFRFTRRSNSFKKTLLLHPLGNFPYSQSFITAA